MALTAEQIAIVKSTAPVVKQHGAAITTVFYQRMLAAHPELKNYFSVRHQHTGAQQAALADAVFAYAAFIDDLPRLAKAVERIANKHSSLFVRPEHYPIVGQFLVAAFAEVLGPALTPAVKDAWVHAYAQLADVFINAERALYDGDGEWRAWRRFVIARKEKVADDVISLYLRPVDGRPVRRFRPGQYVSLQLPIPELDGLLQSRQFSLSLAPRDAMDLYRVSVKRDASVDHATPEDLAAGRVPGLVSNRLHRLLAEGDEVELSPPRGDYFFDAARAPPDGPIVLLSVGVGATPNLSILDAILETQGPADPTASTNGHSVPDGHAGSAPNGLSPLAPNGRAAPAPDAHPITWVHAARHAGGVCFGSHVRAAAARHANLRTFIFLKTACPGDDYDLEGRMSLDRLEHEHDGALHLDNPAAAYYLCGPEQWMVQTRKWLAGRGVAPERINLELFSTGEAQ